MTTEVIIQHFPGEKYRVTGTGRFAVTAEGDTKAEALANFQQRAAYVEVETIEIPLPRNGNYAGAYVAVGNNAHLLASIGTGADIPDEFWQKYLAAIERNREEENAWQMD
ncbi:MAG: hypothetical protein H7Y38_11090 [Armatimonadetes bacterium]|nr:hypothetical protein [Armatimonadota bacterium]